MLIRFSNHLMQDVRQTIQVALAKGHVVNLPLLAEQIRKRNEKENVALEDILRQLMIEAQAFCAPMEFDGSGRL